MGYNLTIGELRVETYDDGPEYDNIRLTAESQEHETAPAFGEPTDYTNERWPSYTAWHEFCIKADIHDIMYDGRNDIIGGHPGVRVITKSFVDEINKRYKRFLMQNPEAKATYGKEDPNDPLGYDTDNPDCNNVLCRFEWLRYWTNWAYENCKVPVLANS